MSGHPRNPYLTVDVVVEVRGGVVLIERARHPIGWALPGGFVDYGEEPADAARREIEEETGLHVELTDLLGTYGAPDRDPRQHDVSIVFVGHASGEPRGGDDAARAGIFALDALPSPLCFDHARVLADYRWWRETGELPTPAPGLRPDVLRDAARDALEAALTGRPARPSRGEQAPWAQANGASFVTLRRPDGSLRGCIGEMVARRPLATSVRDNAVAAALRDPRFAPVTAAELDGLEIGISVLTPTRRVGSPADVVVGKHGVLVTREGHRGVFLPEVAVDQGWDRETYLSAICQKAGLPVDAWRHPSTELAVFETVKINPR
ncbi:MAG: AmmeMemoRadiSam system protein A [Sandaracinaceae bacterium]|nr:AmmeMemoRadiSam system protein A [Sandaracinaceae bacterium]